MNTGKMRALWVRDSTLWFTTMPVAKVPAFPLTGSLSSSLRRLTPEHTMERNSELRELKSFIMHSNSWSAKSSTGLGDWTTKPVCALLQRKTFSLFQGYLWYKYSWKKKSGAKVVSSCACKICRMWDAHGDWLLEAASVHRGRKLECMLCLLGTRCWPGALSLLTSSKLRGGTVVLWVRKLANNGVSAAGFFF